MMDDSKRQTGIGLMHKFREQTIASPATGEQEEYFVERTNRHIGMVQDAIAKILAAYPDEFPGLAESGQQHDASKFEEPERGPYVRLTWNKKNGINQDDPEIRKAVEHHIYNNKHHPEYWSKKE